MADVIDYKIYGEELQVVEVELDPGEGVRAEVGTMLYMEDGIEMQTGTGGGLFRGFKRMITGSGFFISTFANVGNAKSRAGFAAPYPGKVVPLDLGELGGRFICQKDAFLCAASGTEIEVAFTKRLGAGLFGGEGFILQRLEGDGLAFLHAGGTILKRELYAGERLRVDTGCIVGFAPTVDYDIQFVGGFKNALFGGEGLFLATLRGPGLVYLQSLPFSRLADRIIAAANFGNRDERRRGLGSLGGAAIGGAILGDLLGGNDG
ncbi:MAG TPA: TIGR00266 family protein [Longimicrobiales bacterium]|nr:TIGR00266 family protein [Longimicrobiales bacterium]